MQVLSYTGTQPPQAKLFQLWKGDRAIDAVARHLFCTSAILLL